MRVSKLVYFVISFLLFFVALGFSLVIGRVPGDEDILNITTISLTAGSIIFSFFLIVLTSEDIQIGRKTAIFIWLIVAFFFLSAVGSIALYMGLDTILARLSTGGLLFSLSLLFILVVTWVLWRGYYEEPRSKLGRSGSGTRKSKRRLNTSRSRKRRPSNN